MKEQIIEVVFKFKIKSDNKKSLKKAISIIKRGWFNGVGDGYNFKSARKMGKLVDRDKEWYTNLKNLKS